MNDYAKGKTYRAIAWILETGVIALFILQFCCGCTICGEYKIKSPTGEIVLGPGDGKCVTSKFDESITTAIADWISGKAEEPLPPTEEISRIEAEFLGPMTRENRPAGPEPQP